MKVLDCFVEEGDVSFDESDQFVILKCPDWWAMIEVNGGCCVSCVASRIRLATEPEKVALAASRRGLGYEKSPEDVEPQLFSIFNEWKRWLLDQGDRSDRYAESSKDHIKWLRIDPEDLSVSPHLALPDPHCLRCSSMGPDRPWGLPCGFWGADRLNGSKRTRSFETQYEALRDCFVDSSSGLIHRTEAGTFGGMAVSGAFLKFRREEWVDGGFGRTHDFRSAQTVAILEALERYAGVSPGGKLTQTVGSYQDLRGDAVDPRIFGEHERELYLDDTSNYSEFDVNQKYCWVWAYDLTRRQKVLVPEQLAYYFVPPKPDSPLFAFEVSNSCALGGSLAEAIYYGLCEVIERDAFLLTWYRGIQIPRIQIPAVGFERLQAKIRRFELTTGMQVEFYDCTTDSGMPAVFGLATNELEHALPAVTCGAGVGTSLCSAIDSALSEMLPFTADFVARFPEQKDRASALASDFHKVRQMKDHATLFADHRMISHFDFLRKSKRSVVLKDNGAPPVMEDSFEGGLSLLVSRLNELGQRVLVVDQTTPEIAAWDLRCVKVLVSGAVPMTFGHHLRRVRGLPRLDCPPKSMGNPTVPLDQLGKVPHPFP